MFHFWEVCFYPLSFHSYSILIAITLLGTPNTLLELLQKPPTSNLSYYPLQLIFHTITRLIFLRDNVEHGILVLKIFNGLPYLLNESQLKVTQSCLTLQPHGNLQARILEWVAYSFSSRSSQPGNQTKASCIVGGFFTSWATRSYQDWF